jgi:hypothetical protein
MRLDKFGPRRFESFEVVARTYWGVRHGAEIELRWQAPARVFACAECGLILTDIGATPRRFCSRQHGQRAALRRHFRRHRAKYPERARLPVPPTRAEAAA